MKKLNRILVVFVMMMSFMSVGQDLKIEFSQTMATDNADMQDMIDMMGESSMVVYYKNKLIRTDVKNAFTGTMIAIFDSEKKEGITLMDNPFAGKTYQEFNDTTETEEEPNFDIEKLKGTKEIAGYKCKGYKLTDPSGNVTTLYTTESLETEGKSQYGEDVKGVVLSSESEIKEEGSVITIKLEATEVSTDKIDLDIFDMTIPEGYTKSEY